MHFAIVSRMHNFFIVVPISFEALALEEINYKFPKHFPDKDFHTELVKGGINLKCEKIAGLYLNAILKIPTRILLRLKNQKCRDLPKLFNILKKMNWKEYLLQTNCNFSISCSKSRLIHTGRIEKTSKDALAFYFQANKIPIKKLLNNPPDQTIYIRIDNDELTISLDTTGDPLYKRNESTYRGLAGLRENYASGFLLSLLGFNDYSGHTLLDPMAGSGTFIREAIGFFALTKRDFSYQNWNSIEYITLSNLENLWNFKHIYGHDINEQVLDKMKDELNISKQDFFNIEKLKKNTIIIMNPPYGKRIKVIDMNSYFQKIIDKLKLIGPDSIGMIIPKDYSKRIKSKKRLAFNQNGIKVEFLNINISSEAQKHLK